MKFVCAAVIGLSFVSSAALAANAEGIWLSEDGGTKVISAIAAAGCAVA